VPKPPPKTKLQRAVTELGIDVPIYHARSIEGGGLALYLTNGRVIEWTPEHAPLPPDDAGILKIVVLPDDLTDAPGIGKATARALNAAGFTTFRQLALAPDEDLRDILNTYNLAKLRDYLYINGYNHGRES